MADAGDIPKGVIKVPRGDSGRAVIRGPVKRDGVAFDLTGSTIWLSVKAVGSDAEPALIERKTGGAGITLLTQSGATLGQFKVEFTSANTDSMTPGDYDYDIQVKEVSGQISTIEKGLFKVLRDVTRVTV